MDKLTGKAYDVAEMDNLRESLPRVKEAERPALHKQASSNRFPSAAHIRGHSL